MTQRNARSEATIARGEQFGHRNTKTASSDIQKATTEHHMTPGDAYWVGAARPRKPAILPLGPLIFNIIVFICFALS